MSLYRVRDNGLRLVDFNKNQRKVIDKAFYVVSEHSNMNYDPKDTQAVKEVWIGRFEEDFLRDWFKDDRSALKELIVLWCKELGE